MARSLTILVIACLVAPVGALRLNDVNNNQPRPWLEDQKENIPAILHVLWPNKNWTFPGHELEAKEARQFITNFQELNPEYEIRIWDDNDCEELVKTKRPDFIDVYQNFVPYLKKFDAIRPLILHSFGGVYMDVDMVCKNPIGGLFQSGRKVVLRKDPKNPENEMAVTGNHVMASVPGVEMWQMYIDGIISDENNHVHRDVIGITGNGQLSKAAKMYYEKYTEEMPHLRRLELFEFDNGGSCKKQFTREQCKKVSCNHYHALSPIEAETNGDDNAGQQLRDSNRRNAGNAQNQGQEG